MFTTPTTPGPSARPAARAARLTLAAAGLAGTILLSACGGSGTASLSPTAGTASRADCQKVQAAEPEAGVPVAVLVIDRTALGIQAELAPAAIAALTQAQAANAALDVLAVDGPGVPARRVISRVALDPTGGKHSQVADDARRIAISCVGSWATEDAGLPTRAGSDILQAINTAARQHPRWLVIASDGMANGGDVNFAEQGFPTDPKASADAVRATGAVEPLDGSHVTWTQLGETRVPLAQPLRAVLKTYWTRLLRSAGAAVKVDTVTGAARSEAPVALGDAVPLPAVKAAEGVTEIPSTLLFAPDSAALVAGVDQVLEPLVQELTADPARQAVIEGHTADFGTAAGRARLSRARAEAVMGALLAQGVSETQLRAVGYGSTRPQVKEWYGGRHDLAAASTNRRVLIRTSGRATAERPLPLPAAK